MMKSIQVIALSALATLPAVSSAAEKPASSGVQQSAYVTLATNYVFRGLTSSNDNPAVQGGYDIKQSKDDKGWYAGAFLSTFDYGAGGAGDGLETDIAGGWKGDFGEKDKFGYEVGAALYQYQGSDVKKQFELYGGISYETAYFKLYLGDDDNYSNGGYTYFDIGAGFTVLKDIDLGVHFGHMSRDFAKDYNDISATLSKEVNDFELAFSLSYEDFTDQTEFFATITKTFDF